MTRRSASSSLGLGQGKESVSNCARGASCNVDGAGAFPKGVNTNLLPYSGESRPDLPLQACGSAKAAPGWLGGCSRGGATRSHDVSTRVPALNRAFTVTSADDHEDQNDRAPLKAFQT